MTAHLERLAVGGATRVGAVIGWPVAHSKSPALHNAAFSALGIDAVFVALAVHPDQLAAALRGMSALGMLGASVTVPHKEATLPLCDALDDTARDAAAVNCIEFRDRQIIGHNTDGDGYLDALKDQLGREATGARAVLFGGGGAARAVHAALVRAGAADIAVVARTPSKVTFAGATPWREPEVTALCRRADLVIDCTSAALLGAPFPSPIPVDALPTTAAVTTLIYGTPSPLLDAARARGLATMDGAAMLLHQGARAFTLWTGRPAPLAAMTAALSS